MLLEIKNLHVHYGAIHALKGISLEVHEGEIVTLIGSNGAGKSTIANLILGLLPLSEGKIMINGLSIDDIQIKSLRDVVAYVPQDPSLFSGSIKENVMLAKPQASETEYQRAMNTSQLSAEIAAFPLKDETKVGNRGLDVSGGQKQRITIARALIKNPRLLILDDITASLDAENEEKLWQDINAHYPNPAAIVISHRLSTLRYVDKVLFLDSKGHAHIGRHDELVFANQEYHDFLNEHLKK